jgi:hypothetical protein
MKFFFRLALVSTTALVSFVPAESQINDEYPLCRSFATAIGEVPAHPFTARMEEGLRRIQPDGNSVRADSAPDSTAGFVARDNSGRVLIASRITTVQWAEGNMRQWSETICDPLKGTEITLQLRALERSPGSDAVIPNGPDAYTPSVVEGTAHIRVQNGHTTAVFADWHNVVEGRLNLGPETFEDVPANRFRLTQTRDERSIRDVVNSDPLFLQLAMTRWKTYPLLEEEIHLTGIDLGEPPQALFDLPPTVHTTVIPH